MTPLRTAWLLALLWLGWSGSANADPKALLAVIIDDLGYSAELGERTLALPGDFTVSILPMAPHSVRLANLATAQGKEVMLHNPMSNTRDFPLDPGGLTDTMDKARFTAALAHNFELIPQALGLNNHMGSLLTQKAEPMGWLMEFLSARGAYFIDSRTSAASRAWETAQRYRVPSLERDVFLDHERDPEQILKQLNLAVSLAQTRGYAIAIGHPYPETLVALEQLPHLLEATNVELVPISRLLNQVTISLPADIGRSCLAPPLLLRSRPYQPPENLSEGFITLSLANGGSVIKIEEPYTNSIYAARD